MVQPDGQPAIGQLSGQRQVLWTQAGKVNGNALLDRDGSQTEMGQLKNFTLVVHCFAGQRLPDNLDVFSGARQWMLIADAVPLLDNDAPAGPQAECCPALGEQVQRRDTLSD